jgi:hypothetical protein
MSEVREVTEWHTVEDDPGMGTIALDILGPDCRDGKCAACVGDAWDDAADEPTACQCACHDVTKGWESP